MMSDIRIEMDPDLELEDRKDIDIDERLKVSA